MDDMVRGDDDLGELPTEVPTGEGLPPVECEATITIEEGFAAGSSFTVGEFPVVVGRSAQADVQLPDDPLQPTISRRHLRLHLRSGRLYVEDTSSTGTRIGDHELFPREVAAVGSDPLWLGPKTRLRVRLQTNSPQTTSIFARSESSSASHSLVVRCLGGFSVSADGFPVPETLWGTRKVCLLIALLADARGPLSTERLTELLWPESNDGGRGALQTSISRIRRALKGGTFPDPVQFSRGYYALNPSCRIQHDVTEFEACCQQSRILEAQMDGEQAIALLQQGLALYSGPYLDGFSSDWIDVRRAMLRSRYGDAVDRVARWHEANGRLEQAQRTFELLLREDPCDELGRLGVMRCLVGQGRREDAKRQYHEAVRTLQSTLELGPSPAMKALYDAILTSDPRA